MPIIRVALVAVSCIVAFCSAAIHDVATGITYNVPAAMAWLQAQGCSNSSQNPTCPGGIPCYDDEFTARMLAAGGVVNLDPNVASNAAYQSYSWGGDVYDLTTQSGPPAGLYDFLVAIGWYNPQLPGCSPTNSNACYPAGAVIMTKNIWQQPVPLSAIGNGLCSCGSPLNTNAPHCNMPCSYFSGTELFYPPQPKVAGPLIGSYTPNNQTYQDFTLWPNMFNTPQTAINQALTVLEVGWSANDAASVLSQLQFVWANEQAVPVITWMPYPFLTWTNPSPNADILAGKYDTYIDEFLTMLSGWLAGGTLAYLRFAPQPNGDWFPWSPKCPSCGSTGQRINQTVASYVSMWKYVIGKVRSSKYQLGNDVLQVVFDVNNVDAPDSARAEMFYPGSDYVDWLCVTGVNWGNTLPGNQWTSPSGVFSSMVGRLQVLSSTTPLALSGATTSAPNGLAAKNDWIDDFFKYATVAGAKMLLYHNADSSTDLAIFGGSKGSSTWTSPLSQIVYNVYAAWSSGLNNQTYGVQGANASLSTIISPSQFAGNF